MVRKPGFSDIVTYIPGPLKSKAVALGATFNTGCESSSVPINTHNELELKNTLPDYFKVLATLVNRSLPFFFVIEHYPSKAAYQVHCHGVCADLSLEEVQIAGLLWKWHYYNHNFINAEEELVSADRSKHRVKHEVPHAFFKQNSPVEKTVNYAMKGCNSYETVSVINGIAYADIRQNQKWYKHGRKHFKEDIPNRWLEVVEAVCCSSKKDVEEVGMFSMCYLLSSKNQASIT